MYFPHIKWEVEWKASSKFGTLSILTIEPQKLSTNYEMLTWACAEIPDADEWTSGADTEGDQVGKTGDGSGNSGRPHRARHTVLYRVTHVCLPPFRH